MQPIIQLNRKLGCAVVLVAAILASEGKPAGAAVTNLTASADTFINSALPGNNAGAEDHVAAGRDGVGGVRRGLFLFDVSSIPAGSTITSAAFRVGVVQTPTFGSVGSTFGLFRLTAVWGEGIGNGPGGPGGQNGAPASTGEATWNSRQFGINNWTGPGAAGDYGTPALASTFVNGVAVYEWSGAVVAGAVQAWLDSPGQNLGFILVSQSEATAHTARRFGSREGGSPAILIVGYQPPPPPTLTSISIGTNRLLELRWASSPAWEYDVEFTASLAGSPQWRVAEPNVPASGTGTNVWFNPPYLASPLYPSNQSLSYRLRALPAAPAALPMVLDIVATNLISPTVLTHAGDGSRRLFVAEQTGQIRIIDSNRNLAPTPFLDLSGKMTNLAPNGIGGITNAGLNPIYDERGLLGLAFHPHYAVNGRFFVYYSSPRTGPGTNDHESILAEYLVSAADANVADPATERVLLRVDEPEFNHNGGALVFGPDGYLYVTLGDGGGGGDKHPPIGNGQSLNSLLGKVLRLDVDSGSPYAIPADNPFVGAAAARPEIYAYGFRNPWKMAFDRGGSRQLFVADVGQDLWEEINLVRKGGNYGWRILEGNHAYDTDLAQTLGIDIAALDFPIHEYGHGPLGISIIGGFVYRGTNYPALAGKYVFGDFSTSFGSPDGALYYLDETRPGIWERFEVRPGGSRLGRYVKGFGEDEGGELYLLSTTKLGPSGTTGDVRLLRKP